MPKTNWKARLGFKGVDILAHYHRPELLKQYFPGGYFGYDQDGCPIMIDPLGKLDFKGLLHSIKGDEILKLRMWFAEEGIRICKEQSIKLNKDIHNITILADLDGLGLRNMWKPGIQLFNRMATMFEDDYPDLMKQTFVVNAPRLFPVLFALVKPFLSDATKQKIKVFGGNWKQELLKNIDADQLPVHYGGTCYDANKDPMCSEYICYAGDVPRSYYNNNTNMECEGMDFVSIRHGDKFNLEYNVKTEGSILHWYFQTEKHDIGFGIYFKENTRGKLREIIAVGKRESHLVAEDGTFICDEKGIYVVQFDNSYSWTRNKKLFYQIGLTSTSD
eukprot:gene14099-15571_t